MAFSDQALHSSSLGCWDIHNLGVLNQDFSYMENNVPSLMLENEDDSYSNFLSTGYLEDALFEFSLQFKRRRLMLCSNDYQEYQYFPSLEDLSCWSQLNENYVMQSEEELSHGSLLTHDRHYSSGDTNTMVNFIQDHEKTLLLDHEEDISNTPKIMEMKKNYNNNGIVNYNYNIDTYSTDSSSISENEREKMMSKRKVASTTSSTKKMVYPFGLVKPGGEEGDITLKDINKRILMPPTRPLRHPVGDFACRPVVGPHGPGLSGKAVVALTRIQTRGRGTITIIRTKG